ncbi:MAG: hypothetical protein L0H93_10020 [Nocardioides sp.]|nr:hypothetical protein [Nocardioides sp.]
MSQSAHHNRLPYDDPATVQEMHGDCRAATSHLRLPPPRGTTPARAHEATQWSVPDAAARMAGAIHLHLS